MTQASDDALLERDLGYALGVTFRSYAKAAGQVLNEVPGGPRGYQVVAAAAHGSAASQIALAQRLGIDRTVMTYLLDDLEQAGLCARRPDPNDRRNRQVVATDKGRALVTATEDGLRHAEDSVLGALEPEEREQLRGLLRKIAGRSGTARSVGEACNEIDEIRQLAGDTDC